MSVVRSKIVATNMLDYSIKLQLWLETTISFMGVMLFENIDYYLRMGNGSSKVNLLRR